MKRFLLLLFIFGGVITVVVGTLQIAASSNDSISHWSLDETTGTVFADSVDTNDATCDGTSCPLTTVGRTNNALLFDGVNDGLTVLDDPGLNWTVNDNFSIAVWIKGTQDCNKNKVVIGKNKTIVTDRADWWLGCGENNGIDVAKFFLRDSNSQQQVITGTTNISDNSWHHLVATWNATSDEVGLYVDGVEEASATFAFTGTFSNTGNLTMGYYDSSFFFAGAVDEVQIYNVAVVPTFITSIPVEATVIDQSYSYEVTALANPAPAFSLAQFPDGMTIDPSTGQIAWTPTAAGHYNIVVEANNAVWTDIQMFSIDVIDLVVSKSLVNELLHSGESANFTIAITNTSSVPLALTVDDPQELSCVTALPQNTLAAGASVSYPCATGNMHADFTNVITVTGTYAPTTNVPLNVTAVDSASVIVLPSIELSQSLEPLALPEPGGLVTVSLTINNTSFEPVTLTAITVTPFGDVTDAGNEAIAATDCVMVDIAVAESYSCSFSASYVGQPGQYEIVATAVGQDTKNNEANDQAIATITLTNVPSSIAVAVAVVPAANSTQSSSVTFTVEILNTSATDSVVIESLSDLLLGSLNGIGSCNLPTAFIPPGEKYTCSFTAAVSGALGNSFSNTVSAFGTDDDGNPVSEDGVASVNVNSLIFLPMIVVNK